MDSKLKLLFEEKDTHLLVVVSGQWLRDSIKQAISEVGDSARQRGFSKILIDARNLSAPKSDFERFLAGEEIALQWRGLKAAFLYPEERIKKFTENTAVNRGAVIIVLSDMDEALKWLTNNPT